jgi:hypothetical protein
MLRLVLINTTLIATLSTAECTELVGALRQPSTAFASEAMGDEPVVEFRPQLGFVRGTRPVLATLGSPLKPAPGPNRTVAPCRQAAWAEAAKLGARNIEAVSAGPAQLNKKGQFVGRVRMRIMYQKLLGYEVREATMTCVVDRAGKVVGGAT